MSDLATALPFVQIAAAELASSERSRAETLTQALRRAIGVRLREDAEVLEGEVVSIALEHAADEGVAATREARLTLKTTDMETVYEIGAKMLAALDRARVTAGDIVRIDKASGSVTKLGRSLARRGDTEVVSADVAYVCALRKKIR